MTTASITNTQQSRQHEIPRVPFAKEMLQLAKSGYSFQTREILQRIVTAEQQRLREEQMVWRVGGARLAVIGGCKVDPRRSSRLLLTRFLGPRVNWLDSPVAQA